MSVSMVVKDPYYRGNFAELVPASAEDPMFRADGGMASNDRSSKEPARVRVEFPETWLWSDSFAGYLLAYHFAPVLHVPCSPWTVVFVSTCSTILLIFQLAAHTFATPFVLKCFGVFRTTITTFALVACMFGLESPYGYFGSCKKY